MPAVRHLRGVRKDFSPVYFKNYIGKKKKKENKNYNEIFMI